MIHKLTWSIPMPKNDEDGIMCHKITIYGDWQGTIEPCTEEFCFEGSGSLINDPRLRFAVSSQFHYHERPPGVDSDSYYLPADNVVLTMLGDVDEYQCPQSITEEEATERFNEEYGIT